MSARTFSEVDCQADSPKLYIYLLDHALSEIENDSDVQVEFRMEVIPRVADSEGNTVNQNASEKFAALLNNKNMDSKLSACTSSITERPSQLVKCCEQLNENTTAFNKEVADKEQKLAQQSGRRGSGATLSRRRPLTYSERRDWKRRRLIKINRLDRHKKETVAKHEKSNKSSCFLSGTFTEPLDIANRKNQSSDVGTLSKAHQSDVEPNCNQHSATALIPIDNQTSAMNTKKLEAFGSQELSNCLPWVRKRPVSKKTTELYKKKQEFSRAMMPFLGNKQAIYLRNSVKLLRQLIKTSAKQCEYLNNCVLKKVVDQHTAAWQDKNPKNVLKLKLNFNSFRHRWKEQQVTLGYGDDGSWSFLKVLLLRRRRIISRKVARKIQSLKTVSLLKRQLAYNDYSNICKSDRPDKSFSHSMHHGPHLPYSANRAVLQSNLAVCKKPLITNIANDMVGGFLKKTKQSSCLSREHEVKHVATISPFVGDRSALTAKTPVIRSNSGNLEQSQAEFVLHKLEDPTNGVRLVDGLKYRMKGGLAHKLTVMILLRRRNFTFRMLLAKMLARLRKRKMETKNQESLLCAGRKLACNDQYSIIQAVPPSCQLKLHHHVQHIHASISAEFTAATVPQACYISKLPGKRCVCAHLSVKNPLQLEDSGHSVQSQSKTRSVLPALKKGMHAEETFGIETLREINMRKSLQPRCNALQNNWTISVCQANGLPHLQAMHDKQARRGKKKEKLRFANDMPTLEVSAHPLIKFNSEGLELTQAGLTLGKLEDFPQRVRLHNGLQDQLKAGLAHKLSIMIVLRRRNFAFRMLLAKILARLRKCEMESKNKEGLPYARRKLACKDQDNVVQAMPQPHHHRTNSLAYNVRKTSRKSPALVHVPIKHPLQSEDSDHRVQLQSKNRNVLPSAGDEKDLKKLMIEGTCGEEICSIRTFFTTNIGEPIKPCFNILQNDWTTPVREGNILLELKTLEDTQTKKEKQKTVIQPLAGDRHPYNVTDHPLIKSNCSNLELIQDGLALDSFENPTKRVKLLIRSQNIIKPGLAHKLTVMILLRRRNFTFRMLLAKMLSKLRNHAMTSKTVQSLLCARRNLDCKKQDVIIEAVPKLLCCQQWNLQHHEQPAHISTNTEFAAADNPLARSVGKIPSMSLSHIDLPVKNPLHPEVAGHPVQSQSKKQNVLLVSSAGYEKDQKEMIKGTGGGISGARTLLAASVKEPIKPWCNNLQDKWTPVRQRNIQRELQMLQDTQATKGKQEATILRFADDKSTFKVSVRPMIKSNYANLELLHTGCTVDKLEDSARRVRLQDKRKAGLAHKLSIMIVLRRRNFAFRMLLAKMLARLKKHDMETQNKESLAYAKRKFACKDQDNITQALPKFLHCQKLNLQHHIQLVSTKVNTEFASVDNSVAFSVGKTLGTNPSHIHVQVKNPLQLEDIVHPVQSQSKKQNVPPSAGHKNWKNVMKKGTPEGISGVSKLRVANIRESRKQWCNTLQYSLTPVRKGNVEPELQTPQDTHATKEMQEATILRGAGNRSNRKVGAHPLIKSNCDSLKHTGLALDKLEDVNKRVRLHIRSEDIIKDGLAHKLTVMILLRRRNFTFRTILAKMLSRLRKHKVKSESQHSLLHARWNLDYKDQAIVIEELPKSHHCQQLNLQHHVQLVPTSSSTEFAADDESLACTGDQTTWPSPACGHVLVNNPLLREDTDHYIQSQSNKHYALPSAGHRKYPKKIIMKGIHEEICGTETLHETNAREPIKPWCNIPQNTFTAPDKQADVLPELQTIQDKQLISAITKCNRESVQSVSEFQMPSLLDFKENMTQECSKRVHFGRTNVIFISPRRRTTVVYKELHHRGSKLFGSKVLLFKRKLKARQIHIMLLLKRRNFGFRRQMLRELSSFKQSQRGSHLEKSSVVKCKGVRENSGIISHIQHKSLSTEIYSQDSKPNSQKGHQGFAYTSHTSLILKGRRPYSIARRHVYFVTKNNSKNKKKVEQILANIKLKTVVDTKGLRVNGYDSCVHSANDSSSLSLFSDEGNLKTSKMVVTEAVQKVEPQQQMLIPLDLCQPGPYTIRIVPGLSNTQTNYRKKHPFTCSFCAPPFTTLNKDELCLHIKTEHPERCKRCRKTFLSKTERQRHFQECLKIKEEHHCNICQKMYYDINRFKRHIKGKMHRFQVSVHKNALRHIIQVVTGQPIGVSGNKETMQNYQAPRTRYYYDDSEMVELFHSVLGREKEKSVATTPVQQEFWAPVSPPETDVGQDPFMSAATTPSTSSVLDDCSNESYDSTIVEFLHSHPSSSNAKLLENVAGQSLPPPLIGGCRDTACNILNSNIQILPGPSREGMCSFVSSSEKFYNSTNVELVEKYPNLVVNSDIVGRTSLMMPDVNCAHVEQYGSADSYDCWYNRQPDSSEQFMEALNDWWRECGL